MYYGVVSQLLTFIKSTLPNLYLFLMKDLFYQALKCDPTIE